MPLAKLRLILGMPPSGMRCMAEVARSGSLTHLLLHRLIQARCSLGLFDRESNTSTVDRQKAGATTTEAPNVAVSQPPMPRQTAPTPSSAPIQPAKMTGRVAFKIRWTNAEGEVFSEAMQVLSSTGKGMGQIRKPEGWPRGTYRVEFLVNDTPAATMDFEIQ